MNQCHAIMLNGKQCKNNAHADQSFCYAHWSYATAPVKNSSASLTAPIVRPAPGEIPFIDPKKQEAIGREAKWTAILLGLITLLAQPVALHVLAHGLLSALLDAAEGGTASLGAWLEIWKVFGNTAPLSLAFAFLFIHLVIGNLPGDPRGFLFAGAVLAVAAGVGNMLGYPYIEIPPYPSSGAAVWVVSILRESAAAYGASLFFSSAIVGVFLSRAYQTWTGTNP